MNFQTIRRWLPQGAIEQSMNNEKRGATDSVIKDLEINGFRAALIPYSSIEIIRKIFDSYPEREDTPFSIKEWFLSKQPPDIAFEPLSFLVIAYQSAEGEMRLSHKGKEVLLPIPPTYLDGSKQQRLDEVLKEAANGWNSKNGYQISKAKGISMKLLAVLSGLGKYGRNALCYIEGWGSSCNFDAYYTDIPCEEKAHEPVLMDLCQSCGLCTANCPNDAFGGQYIFDASRCLTLWNEHNEPMPDWLAPSVHHTAIGCMRCQEVCPVNKAAPIIKKEPLELSEAETEALLSLPSVELPPDLVKRLLDYGLWEMFVPLAGRNIKLALEAMGV